MNINNRCCECGAFFFFACTYIYGIEKGREETCVSCIRRITFEKKSRDRVSTSLLATLVQRRFIVPESQRRHGNPALLIPVIRLCRVFLHHSQLARETNELSRGGLRIYASAEKVEIKFKMKFKDKLQAFFLFSLIFHVR